MVLSYSSNGVASGTALSYNHPAEHIREDFGTMRSDYIIGERDSLSAAYTIDDGNSLIPAGRSFVRVLFPAPQPGGQRAGDAYLFAAHDQYLHGRAFRARVTI